MKLDMVKLGMSEYVGTSSLSDGRKISGEISHGVKLDKVKLDVLDCK